MAGWYLDPTYAGLRTEFGDLASVFALEGKRLTRDPLPEVVLIERDGNVPAFEALMAERDRAQALLLHASEEVAA